MFLLPAFLPDEKKKQKTFIDFQNVSRLGFLNIFQ